MKGLRLANGNSNGNGSGFRQVKPQSTMELKLLSMGYRVGSVYYKNGHMYKRYVRGRKWIDHSNADE